MKKNLKINYDKFVDAVQPSTTESKETVLMSGFIGKSNEDNHIRLYADASLNDFVEIPEDSIVHCEALDKTTSPLGGSNLWIKPDAVVTMGDPKDAIRVKKQLLDGDLLDFFNSNRKLLPSELDRIPACGWDDNPTITNCAITRTGNVTCLFTKTGNPCRINRTRILCNLGRTIINCRLMRTNCGAGRTQDPCGVNYSLKPWEVVGNNQQGNFGDVGLVAPGEEIPTRWTTITPVIMEPSKYLNKVQLEHLGYRYIPNSFQDIQR